MFAFIRAESTNYPVHVLYRVMQVAKSGFYEWEARATTVDLHLHGRAKELFRARTALAVGSWQKVRTEGFHISSEPTLKLMKKLNWWLSSASRTRW